jgi:predicted nucleotidyltransferase
VQASHDCERLIGVAHRLAETFPDTDARAIFLFGSAAWGDADEASDLDIMHTLDRPAGYREVTRSRVADLLGLPASLPQGPLFVDIDRVSAATFEETLERGGWVQRVVNSVVLRDTDGWFARLRERTSAEYASPAAVEARFRKLTERAEAQRAEARAALAAGDAPLATLQMRLAVQAAAGALLELAGDRQSVTHFVESAERALELPGRSDLWTPFLRALALESAADTAERSLRIYDAFQETLKRWLDEPAIRDAHSAEALTWARFSYGDESREELRHKAEAFGRLGRLPTLQYCLDGMFHLLIGINFGRALHARHHGTAERIPLPAFHTLLRREPELFDQWVRALRLEIDAPAFEAADALVDQLIAAGKTALPAGAGQG